MLQELKECFKVPKRTGSGSMRTVDKIVDLSELEWLPRVGSRVALLFHLYGSVPDLTRIDLRSLN